MAEWKVVDQFNFLEEGVIACNQCDRPVTFPPKETVVCFRCPFCSTWNCLRTAVVGIRHDMMENPERYQKYLKGGDI